MASVDADTPRTAAAVALPYIQWGPIVAGAIIAAATALLLHSFATGIGIAVSSTAPTWRDGSAALWLLSGLYLLLVSFVSYGLGGYIAGRSRQRIVAADAEEIEIRDGGHGLIVWAIATLLTAIFALSAAQSLTRLAAPPGASGPASSVAGENIIAYDLDKLLRSDRPPPANMDMAYTRAEAARILLTVGGHTGLTADDRAHLVRLVAARTGLAQQPAESRVDAVVASARENIRRSRRSAVLLAFMAGAAALMGAAVAWFAACAGGRHHDGLRRLPVAGWRVTGPRFGD